jgi:uncharacterized membrane protein YfcA
MRAVCDRDTNCKENRPESNHQDNLGGDGISFAIILFFLLFYSHTLIPSRWLELALAITLYFSAARMFKEAFENTDEEKEVEEIAFKYGYITAVSL